MSLRVRCCSCNRIIGHLEEKYLQKLEEGLTEKEALNFLNIRSYCCRMHFLGYVPILDKLLQVPNDVYLENEREIKKNE